VPEPPASRMPFVVVVMKFCEYNSRPDDSEKLPVGLILDRE
jgi:hypothetical protein